MMVLLLAACAQAPEEEEEALAVQIATWCTDDPCTTVTATAVATSGRPDSWAWRWDEAPAGRDQTIEVPVADGLILLEVEATSPSGAVAYDAGVVAVTPVGSSDRVVFVPFTECSRIPVVSIGGCITGGTDPLTVSIAAADTYTVTFSTPDSYASDQPDAHAVWRLGSVEGHAPGTSASEYYTPEWPAPPDPAEHFTFYFEGVVPGTAVLLASHGGPDGEVVAKHELAITCDAEGSIEKIGRHLAASN